MEHFLKLASGVDITPLLLAVKRRPDLWREDTHIRDYPQGPFKDVESIILRFPIKPETLKKKDLKKWDQHESVDYPPYALLPEARQLVNSLMTRVSGERLGRVVLNKLRPGGRIFAHEDSPEHASYYERFHIVLHSSPGVLFRAGEESVHMGTGEVWWFNNAINHEVINNSASERIHLIVDIKASK